MVQQALATAHELDARYAHTAAALHERGISTGRVLAEGGPFEPVGAGDATFKQLFTSWKKLDNLADGAIAVPSDKPVKTAAFTRATASAPIRSAAAPRCTPGSTLPGRSGTPIYATADGIVDRRRWNNGGYGNLVEIDHGQGIQTRYGHFRASSSTPASASIRGQLIALMGSTGRSTGSHLHYEVRIDGRAVNPIPFMQSTDYLLAMQNKSFGAHSMDTVALGGPARR